MRLKHMCLIFGITPPVASAVIRDLLQLTCRVLSDHILSDVRFPNRNEMAEYAALVHLREPLVNNVIGFVDGCAMRCECSSDTLPLI